MAKPRRKRPARRQRVNPLLDPTQQLSGRQLGRGADALVALELNPQRRSLDREERRVTTQGTALADRAGDYYRQLAQEEAGRSTRSAAIGELLRSKLTASGAQAAGAIDTGRQQAERLAAEDQSVRGTGLTGVGATEEEARAAAARAAAGQQSSLDNEAGTTADYQRLVDLSGRATAAAGGETQRRLLNLVATRRADIADRRSALDATEGPLRRKGLLDLRQQGFENLVTQEGLGIKRADLQAQIASDRADQTIAGKKLTQAERENRRQARIRREQIAATRRGQDISAGTQRRGQDISATQQEANRQSREAIARSRRTGQKVETADAKKIKQGISNAVVDLGSDPKLSGKPPAEQARILRKRGAPALVIRAARERASGGLNYDTAAELRALGIRVPRAWLRRGSSYNKGSVPG